MSDEVPPPADAEPAPSRLRRLRGLVALRWRLALSAVLALAVMAGGGWGLWSSRHAGEVVIEIGDPLVYRPLPELLADLKPSGNRIHHIRLTIVAQVPEAAEAAIAQKEPEILAQVQAHLRELERRELIGQAGSDRLRRDVLAIVNAAIAPSRAHGLLFTQFLLD